MNVNRLRKQISEEILTLFVTGRGRGPGHERELGRKADFRRNSDPVRDRPWSRGLVVNVNRVGNQISEEILTLFVTARGRGPGREREQGRKADFRRNSEPVRDRPWSGAWS